MDTTGDASKDDDHNEKQPNIVKVLTTDDLYSIFWNMQKSFAHPPQVVQPEVIAEFKQSLEATLAKFKTLPKLLSANSSDATKRVKRDIETVEREDFMTAMNPKYLTSKELFDLEASTRKHL
jgi:THO complex subunit 1